MKKGFLTIFSVSAVALALTLYGCGGTNPQSSATQSEPVLSDGVAATLNLESDDADREASDQGSALQGWDHDGARYKLAAVVYRLPEKSIVFRL